MTRHLTRVMPTFVQPIAKSIALRARVFGVFVGFLTALTVFGAVTMFTELGHRNSDATLAKVIVGVICAGLVFWTYTIFRLAGRASRLAQRTADADARFIMETTRVGELGSNGGVIPETAIRITAEQFTQLLSTPRPPLEPGTPVGPTPDVPRAIVHRG